MTWDAIKQRNDALTKLDLEWARRQVPRYSDAHVLLMALHKARYECTDIAPELRHASGAWLRERGYHRLTGRPLLPEGELPKRTMR